MLAGVVSGTVFGFFFHREGWLGGYGSLARRMVRLGHISFFGLGFINLFFFFSVNAAPLPLGWMQIASIGLLVGAISMPLCCFLMAWRAALWGLFVVPTLAEIAGITSFLIGWLSR